MALYISPGLASDAEVDAAVQVEAIARAAADLLKQDAGTAATDAELTAAVATLGTAIDLKQDSATAATDAETAAAIASVVTLAPATSARNTIVPTAVGAVPLIAKGMIGQTANLLELQDSAGAFMAFVSAGGTVGFANRISAGGGSASLAQLDVAVSTPARIGAVVKAAASQTANIAEFQNSGGSILTLVSPSGSIRTSSSMAAGTTSVITNAQFASIANAAGFNPIVGKGAVSQTANLFELRDSADAVKLSVAPNGAITVGDLSQTTPMLMVLGGSAGNPMIRLNRTGQQFSWALTGGTCSFSDDTNGQMVGGFTGQSGVNALYLGPLLNQTVNARPSILSASTHSNAAGADVAGQALRLQGGLGVGTSTPGSVEFWTAIPALTTVPHTATVRARIDSAGDFSILTNGRGVSLKSPDGLTTKKLTIDNAGALALI